MRKAKFCLQLLLFAAWPLTQPASSWEWHLAAGPWTLAPFTSPVARQAERLVSEEASRLLAPLLTEFTAFTFRPEVQVRSRGSFASAGCWRRLARDRFALGFSVSVLNFSLPFTLTAEQDVFFLAIPVAHVSTRGDGQLDLRTIMLTAQGRWRILQAGRTGIHVSLGLTMLRFSGDLHLPLTATVQTFMGTAELRKSEDKTLAELRADNHDIPAWIAAPALALSLQHRLGARTRLLLEINMSQGTFLAAGLSFGR